MMTTPEKVRAAEDAAKVLVSAWAVDPIPLPVDPIRIAGTLGIEVFDEILEPDVSGAIVKEKGHDPVILLNAADSPNRKRFTCAHEIGHFVAHTNAPSEDGYEYVDLRGTLASEGTDPEEIYANEFAACLLMPEDEVRRMEKENRTPTEMAAIFRVSDDAISFRRKNLGLA